VTAATKPWYRSRTILVNAGVAALVALEAVSGLLQPHLPVNFYTAIAVGLPVVNAILRVVTSEALR
jgi:hypothetical protein